MADIQQENQHAGATAYIIWYCLVLSSGFTDTTNVYYYLLKLSRVEFKLDDMVLLYLRVSHLLILRETELLLIKHVYLACLSEHCYRR